MTAGQVGIMAPGKKGRKIKRLFKVMHSRAERHNLNPALVPSHLSLFRDTEIEGIGQGTTSPWPTNPGLESISNALLPPERSDPACGTGALESDGLGLVPVALASRSTEQEDL